MTVTRSTAVLVFVALGGCTLPKITENTCPAGQMLVSNGTGWTCTTLSAVLTTEAGASGPSGATGPRGATGAAGTGAKGATGSTGAAGVGGFTHAQVFDGHGTYNFQVPSGVSTLLIEAWGAGGGGGLGTTGGGGGGSYGKVLAEVVAGTMYSVTVGQGGLGGATGAGGTASSVGTLIQAPGGSGAASGSFGAGGSAATGTGVISFPGGAGGYSEPITEGEGNYFPAAPGGNAGGGGGAGGPIGNPGANGVVPGGGGSSQWSASNITGTMPPGGTGADGRVVIWW